MLDRSLEVCKLLQGKEPTASMALAEVLIFGVAILVDLTVLALGETF